MIIGKIGKQDLDIEFFTLTWLFVWLELIATLTLFALVIVLAILLNLVI